MKMDGEIQNICVNPLERCRDYKCKSLFADVITPNIIILLVFINMSEIGNLILTLFINSKLTPVTGSGYWLALAAC